VNRGGTATYFITVQNAGPAVATNVVVNDPIPTGFAYVTNSSEASCNQVGSAMICVLGNLSAGQQKTFSLVFSVPTISGGCVQATVQNTATVGSATPEPNTSNNVSTTVSTNIFCDGSSSSSQGTSLSITKSDGVSTAEPGDELVYTITVTNNNAASIGGISLSDTLPDDVIFLSAENGGNLNGDTVNWNNLFFNSFESRTFRVTVEVTDDVDDGDIIRNTASLSIGGSASDTTTIETDDDDDDSDDDDFTVEKEASTREVFPGGTIDYTIRIENDSNETVRNIVITDQFDEDQLTIIDDDDADENDDGELVWEIDELEEGESETIRYTAVLRSSVFPGSTVRNEVEVKGSGNRKDDDSVIVSVIGNLPQTGGRNGTNGGQFLRPLSAATSEGGSAFPLAALLSLAASGLGIGGYMSRKFFI